VDAPLVRCPLCGAPFSCGRDAPGGCWCAELESLSAEALASLARLQLGARCLCERCLAEQIAGRPARTL
jgi:hypothetical protein